MNLTLKKMAMVAVLNLVMAQSVQAVEILSNGGFETGNFSGWNVGPNPGFGGCDQAWTVASSGSQCNSVSGPIGTRGAYTSLDGNGPFTRTLSQAFNLASVGVAILSWSEAASWNNTGALPRLFSIDLRNSSSVVIANVYTETFAGRTTGSFGLTGHSVDVSALLAAYVGQNVNIAFTTYVPQIFTGPAGFLLDGVSLDVTEGLIGTADIPEPASLALLGLGLLGLGLSRRRRAS